MNEVRLAGACGGRRGEGLPRIGTTSRQREDSRSYIIAALGKVMLSRLAETSVHCPRQPFLRHSNFGEDDDKDGQAGRMMIVILMAVICRRRILTNSTCLVRQQPLSSSSMERIEFGALLREAREGRKGY